MSTTLMQAHRQWADRPADERFESLAALRASVHGRRMRSRAQNYPLSDMKIDVDGDAILLQDSNLVAEPSHWAFGQLSSKLGAPSSYLRTLPAPLAAECLREGISKLGTDSTEVKLMSLAGDEGNVLQAVTSPTYGRIWDADVVDMAGRIVEKTGGAVL